MSEKIEKIVEQRLKALLSAAKYVMEPEDLRVLIADIIAVELDKVA